MAEVSGVQFQCEDCGRVYMTDMALKKHKLSHSAIRPYKCSRCPKTFPMRYMVKDHERMHTGEALIPCAPRLHERMHTGDTLVPILC